MFFTGLLSALSSKPGPRRGTLLAKALALAGLVLAGSTIIALAGGADTPPPLVENAYRVAESGKPMVFMGDSSTYWFAPEDQDQRGIAAMLDAALGGGKVAGFVGAGVPPNLFPDMLTAVLRHGGHPSMVVACANPRALSPVWDLHPFWQFPRERLYLKHDSTLLRLFYRPLAIFQAFNLRPVDAKIYFDGVRTCFADNGRAVPEVLSQPMLPQHLIPLLPAPDYFYASYCAPLSPDNRQFRALAELRDRTAVAGMCLLFYIPPLNYQAGQAYLGNAAHTQREARIAQMAAQARAPHVRVLDLSTLLTARHFTSKALTEHIDATGRHAVAQAIAEAIEQWDAEP